MVLKSILDKIQPTNQNEEYFYKVMSSLKSPELDSRNLTYAFMNESISYPEALSFASSALAWVLEWESNYLLFESKALPLLKSSAQEFVSYCKRKNYYVKESWKSLFAHDESRFRCKYDKISGEVYLNVDVNEELMRIKLVNDFIGE